MRVGIVSDSHGHVPYTREAIRLLESLQVELVIHCGDIGSTEIVGLFSHWPTHFVFGNVDHYDLPALREAIADAGQHCHERFGQLTLENRNIAFLHSDDHQTFTAAIASEDWDVICYGHTHVAETHHVGPTLLLNPGALYRANPHSFAILDLPELKVENIAL